MGRFGALPTWVCYLMMRPFMPTVHPLRSYIGLRQWHAGQSSICRVFDLVLALSIAQILALIVLLQVMP